ncbi:MAG: hypothetical protein LBD23_17350 [Oscillospiraceae bacterium]|nr:hypothetical protein [Oscillospiraceae bacterium]
MTSIKPCILLIGCGPHAKRVYLPAIKATEKNFSTVIKAVVEVKNLESDTMNYVSKYYDNVEGLFIKPFNSTHTHTLPLDVEQQLNSIVEKHTINSVVITTDPLNHMQYALWVQKQDLHILMDKPVSTYGNVSIDLTQAKQIKDDFNILMDNYSPDKAFIINAQRRFLPQFEVLQTQINNVAKNYGMPITSLQSTHSDGQWRLPNEILTQTYHPYIGWGKVSHSGYHLIDMAGKIVRDSYKNTEKRFDDVSVFSHFIRPSGLLRNQSQQDLAKIFGLIYNELDPRSDEELTLLYKYHNEAEIDATALINLSVDNIPLTNITLNLLHTGFCRRDWMMPGVDLYKGNGRVRHEYHNIQQGPLQNIQAHSYQSSDKHDFNTEEDFMLGGNNHYDIHIYRNVGIIGGIPLDIITARDLAAAYSLDKTKVMNEIARHRAVNEFVEVVIGKRKVLNLKASLPDHNFSTQLMSMIYESGIKKMEIRQPLRANLGNDIVQKKVSLAL